MIPFVFFLSPVPEPSSPSLWSVVLIFRVIVLVNVNGRTVGVTTTARCYKLFLVSLVSIPLALISYSLCCLPFVLVCTFDDLLVVFEVPSGVLILGRWFLN